MCPLVFYGLYISDFLYSCSSQERSKEIAKDKETKSFLVISLSNYRLLDRNLLKSRFVFSEKQLGMCNSTFTRGKEVRMSNNTY